MTIDGIYLKIGQEIFNAIEDENWEKARLEIKVVDDGVVGYTGDFQIENQVKDISLRKINREIRFWIRELHEITTEGGNNQWNRAIFTLTANNDFDMEFIWDQALDDEIKRLAK